MRKIIVLLATLGALFSVGAQAAEGTKVAVVDLTRAIFATEVAKARVKQLGSGSDYASLQAKYESITADIKALQEDAEVKSATWSNEQAAEYKKKVEYLLADRELAARKIQTEQKALQGSIVNELQPKAGQAIKELMEEGKIDLLMNAEAVIFAKPEMDITAKLTDRLNKMTK